MRQKMLMVLICMGIGIYLAFPKSEEPVYVNQGPIDVKPIEVDIFGEINMPGTYYFFDDTTYYDIIHMAGGLTINADESSIPFTKIVQENTSITVNKAHQTDEIPLVLLNVNQASFAELIAIPYISESMAAYIIMYREEHGDFTSLDALVNVKYIGAATLEKIKPYLKLS